MLMAVATLCIKVLNMSVHRNGNHFIDLFFGNGRAMFSFVCYDEFDFHLCIRLVLEEPFLCFAMFEKPS